MSFQPQQQSTNDPYVGTLTPGAPIGQPLQPGPAPVNHLTHPGHGPPPPIPGNHPNVQYQQPHGSYPLYPPPTGTPQNSYQPQYYAPPPGPPAGYPVPSQNEYPAQYYPVYLPQGPPPSAVNPHFPPPVPGQQYPLQTYPTPPPFQAPHQYLPTAHHQPQGPLWYLGTPIPDPFSTSTSVQHGVHKVPGYDPIADVEAIRKATKGFGTNDAMLISSLVPLSAMKIDALAQHFVMKVGKKLVDVLDSETSSWFGMGIHGLATGPLAWDVELVHQALAGIGTNETLLTELLIGRPTSELRLLIAGYRHKYGRDLVDKVRGDLSGKTERMFLIALNANRPPDSMPVNQAEVVKDVDALYKAGQGKLGTDEMVFCEILINRSQPHLTAVIGAYGNKYRSLTKVIKSEFSGHMRAGLLHIVHGAKPKRDTQGIWRDAKLLDKAMVGLGTKDAQLVWRLVRAHWDPRRMDTIKKAYKERTKKELSARVASETSGSYKKLVVALCG